MRVRAAEGVTCLVAALLLGCGGDETTLSSVSTTSTSTVATTAPDELVGSTAAPTTTIAPEPSTAPDPGTTDPPATTTSTTSTTALPEPVVPVEPLSVLAVDVDGAWLWSEEAGRRLMIDGAVGSAIPDRVGGIVYQNVETGAWRADWSGAPANTARWLWVGTGSPEPIRRVLRPGGPDEIVVEPPPDGAVQLVDVAIVDGHPTLAYLRTRHFTITSDQDVNPWWDSRVADLIVRDLTTGSERVVRTQSTGWEYSDRQPSIGAELVAEAVQPYGDGPSRIELLDFDGAVIDTIEDLPGCEFGCGLIADLDPGEGRIAFAHPQPYVSGRTSIDVDVTVRDRTDGSELVRTTLRLPDSSRVTALDTAGGRTLLVPATSVWPSALEHPELGPGDRSGWVVVLQLRLSQSESQADVQLAADGVFGPLTESAVRAFQTDVGLDPNGIVDTATWDELIAASGWIEQLSDPIVIEPDGSFRSLPVAPSAPTPNRGSGPTMTLWTGDGNN